MLTIHGTERSSSPTMLSVPLLGACCMCAEMPLAHSAVSLFGSRVLNVSGGVTVEAAVSVRVRGFPCLGLVIFISVSMDSW